LTINTYHSNFKDKHLWVKKATGLDVTEFMLRILAWLCTKDGTCGNGQMCIVTGPNIDIATKLIKRLKGIFEHKLGLTFDNKETVLELNGCTIEAYPSNHLDAYRALENPKFILIDEGDFFRKSEQEDVRFVTERYIGKSDPYIVMVSTPNAPNGLFEKIEREPEDSCIYKRLKMDYTYGLNRIYSKEEIDKAKKSPSFGREYDLQYLGLIGNTFHTQVSIGP
jgi:late competence protein required for DNA uptake (superfamily II DNA/RNA helicase)